MSRADSPSRRPAAELIELDEVLDARGRLTVIEGGRLPFAIARAYVISEVPPAGCRGGHAHRYVAELIVAAAGRFTVECDDGVQPSTVDLDRPSLALLVQPMVWRELSGFSEGSACLVLASHEYDEDEYIRDYAQFTALVADARP